MAQQLTPQQIQELADSPRLDEVLHLLTPQERQQVELMQQPPPGADTAGGDTSQPGQSLGQRVRGALGTGAKAGLGVATGFAKEAGASAFRLGDFMRDLPLFGKMDDPTRLGSVTDRIARLFSPEADPEEAFSRTPQEAFPAGDEALFGLNLEPKEGTSELMGVSLPGSEEVGAFIEQMAEFFVPAGPGKAAAIRGLVRLVPSNVKLTPAVMRAITVAGGVTGEAGSAGAVSALRGEERPGIEATIGGAGPVVGEGLAGATRLLGTAAGKRLAPLLTAIAAIKAVAAVTTPLGLGGGLGTFSVARSLASQGFEAAQNPSVVAKIQSILRGLSTGTARLAAGGTEQFRRRRREREAAPP